MKRFLKNYRLSENIEVLFMLMIGIVLQMTDGSPFSLEQRWLVVWETELPSQYFSQFVQKFIKTVLSIIVVVRCLTTYVYVVSAMLVICSILKNTSPKLMLLWLLIAAIKSVFMTFLEALTGVYVCSAFGKIRKACIEFFISKALEIIFAAYLWASVLNIYQEMERKEADSKKPQTWEQLFMQKMINGRQRTRSLLDHSTLHKTACLNYFEFKDVPQVILQMLRREEEMSEDSLLGPGMMLASVSNLGSFDNLKTSQSLGELGLVDLKSTQVMGLEDDEMLSPPDKALKFLRLTWSDVRKVQRNKKTVENEVYTVDDDTWDKLAAKGANVTKPKQPRAEIFLKEIPGLEKESEEKIRNKTPTKPLDLKFGWSLINFFQEQDAELSKTFDEQDEEISSIAYNQEETDDYEDEAPLFMSNIRDEVLVNRIRLDFVSRAAKGNAYANLYKQDYMSVIGPEVFERASKLPKVTSFTKYHEKMGTKRSSSLPAFSSSSEKWKKKISFEEKFMNKEEMPSKSDLCFEPIKEEEESSNERLILEPRKSNSYNQTSAGNLIEIEDISCRESNRNVPRQEISDDPSDTKKKAEDEVSEEQNQSTKGKYLLKLLTDKFNKKDIDCSTLTDSSDCCEEKIPCFKKRRINIKRIGRRIKVQVGSDIPFSNDTTPLNEPENDSDNSSPSKTFSERLTKNRDEPESNSRTSRSDDSPQEGYSGGDKKEIFKTSANQFFIFSELMHQPLTDALITYNDLKSKINPYSNIDDLLYIKNSGLRSALFRTYRTLIERENVMKLLPFEDSIRTKAWKSKVLKTVTAYHGLRTESSHRAFQDEFILNLYKRKIAMEKILTHTYRDLLSERLYQVWDGYNVLTDDKGSEDSIPEKGRDDLIVKSYVFLDSSDSEESVGDRSIRETKNATEDIVLLNTSSISLLSDASDKCESCANLKNIISRKSVNNNEDRAVLELNTNRPQLIRNWLNSSFTEESDTQNGNYGSAKISETDLYQKDCEKLDNTTSVEELVKTKETNKRKGLIDVSDVVNTTPGQDSFCSQDSDEPFSLYYSKAADLASPLLDMRRFIYPDHIHYSYKHVKKKGFDVDISGGLPLIVRESLTMNTPVSMKKVSASVNPEIGITRKPMDLSFAKTDAFTEWQNNDKSATVSELDSLTKDSSEILQDHQDPKNGTKSGDLDSSKIIKKGKQAKRSKGSDQGYWSPKNEENKKSKPQYRNSRDTKYFCLIKDYLLLKKLLKVYRRKINMEVKKSLNSGKERSPTQISSTQLHSNKGRINSTYNPAISLHENKTRTEKKKMETQEERTKVMFARLEREVLLQNKNKNANKTFGPLRHI